jgi:hypothetical protein
MRSWDTIGRMNVKLGYSWQDGRKGGKQLTGWMRNWDTDSRMDEKLRYMAGRTKSWEPADMMDEKLGYSAVIQLT